MHEIDKGRSQTVCFVVNRTIIGMHYGRSSIFRTLEEDIMIRLRTAAPFQRCHPVARRPNYQALYNSLSNYQGKVVILASRGSDFSCHIKVLCCACSYTKDRYM